VSRVARAALLGLLAGLLAGALGLGVASVRHAHVNCEGLTPQECAFSSEVGAQLGRLQGLGALGLGLVAAGLGLALRRASPPAGEGNVER
jgi:hypothetical protein